MKKSIFYLIVLFLIPTVLFTSCKDDGNGTDTPTVAAIEVLSSYLTTQDMDLGSIMKYHGTSGDIKFVAGQPATANDVAGFISKYHIIDIRSANDYATSHIEGAISVPPGSEGSLEGVLTEAANATKPILVVCYTGQTACYATSLLRLYGYPDAQALKWGMSGWNNSLDKWTANSVNAGSPADGNANWSYDPALANATYDLPAITVTGVDGLNILKQRVEAVAAAGFKGVNGTDVLDNPAGYFVNNYFSTADFDAFGHIKNAYRISPLTLAGNEIKNLDPSQKIVTYCYTGQTSAVITAFLRVLGYDAYSLKFGMNGLYNSNSAWTTNQWSAGIAKDYPVVQ